MLDFGDFDLNVLPEEMRQWNLDYVDWARDTDDDTGSFSTDAELQALPSQKPEPAVVNVRVGVGVIIQDGEGRVLVGIRKGSHGAGTLALPGWYMYCKYSD